MKISLELVNNELLSTLIVAFGCCYIVYNLINILALPIETLLHYLLDKIFKNN